MTYYREYFFRFLSIYLKSSLTWCNQFMRYLFLLALVILLVSCHSPAAQHQTFDVIIRHGTIYDGSGAAPFTGDVAIQGDTIASLGTLVSAKGKIEIDATGLAVAPGFINMLSWADQSLLMDGRSMSNIKQGVTLEVLGEGWSPGPVKRNLKNPVDSLWTTLDGYYKWLLKKGMSPNVASMVGHSSVRNCVMGYDNRKPTKIELDKMKMLVAQAMEHGALGLGTALIYPPASYSSTEELVELARVASHYRGIYTTHMRSEGDFIFDALHETFRIAREADIPVEIYHLKINLSRNWNKIDTLLYKIDSAQRAGLKISADMYPYAASGTGLTARLPNWVQEGGAVAMRKRLRNPVLRKKVLYEMEQGIPYKNSDPKDVMLLGFRLDSLKKLYSGKRLNEVASLHGKNADETVIDLVVRDKSRIEAIYFSMSEENVRRILKLPYTSVGSDGGSLTISKTFEAWDAHPRIYGTFARILGKYVRDEKIISLEEAIRKMTLLPAKTLNIRQRGNLKQGYYADVAVFDPASIQDHATFENPHQYSTGMKHVFVNGKQVLDNGEHTGVLPGRIVYGPGLEGANH